MRALHVDETRAQRVDSGVVAGEADAVLADKDFLAPIVESSQLVFLGDVYLGGGIGMAFRESDDEMRAKFDAAITSMKEDGSLNTLIEKW